MLKIKNKNIYLNRGDAVNIQVACNNATFEKNDYIKFYIMEQDKAQNVLFEKKFTIEADSNTVNIALTSDETKTICPAFDTGYKTFWYEIEYNGSITLMGYDDNGAKLLVIYPEAISKGGNA